MVKLTWCCTNSTYRAVPGPTTPSSHSNSGHHILTIANFGVWQVGQVYLWIGLCIQVTWHHTTTLVLRNQIASATSTLILDFSQLILSLAWVSIRSHLVPLLNILLPWPIFLIALASDPSTLQFWLHWPSVTTITSVATLALFKRLDPFERKKQCYLWVSQKQKLQYETKEIYKLFYNAIPDAI